ncbi:MAG: TolC family protein [Bacteroidales bacterium]|nr:TolC family protein [Bacteroidales bacterium]
MKKSFLLNIFFFIASIAFNQNITEDQKNYQFTLEDCINYAVSNSYTLQSYGLNQESVEAGLRQARQLRLPSVSASMGESFSNSKSGTVWNGNASIGADMILYQGGNINNQIAQNKLLTEQAEYQTQQYTNSLTLSILQAFLTVLSNEELLKNQEKLIETTEQQMLQGKVQYDAGQILESDYLLLKAQYASDLSNITDSRISRDNSILNLKILLSMNPLDNLHIIYPDTTALIQMAELPGLDSVINRTYATYPDLKLSQSSIEMSQLYIKSAQSSYYPSLSLSAGVSTGHNPDFNEFGNQLSNKLSENISLNLKIPIYSNSQTKTKVYQNKIALQQSELDFKQKELDILQTVTQNYQNVVSYYNKYEASQTKEQAYLESFNAYNAMYNAGAITVVELLQQQNNYLNALNDYIQNKYSFILMRKLLDVYMGIPVKI